MDTPTQPLQLRRGAEPWDDGAPGWDRHRYHVHQWLAEATAIMLDAAGIATGMRVLDIAAGAGDQTLDIAQRVGPQGAVLATDISAQMIARAQARMRAAGHTHVQAEIADAQQLGLAGSQFDAALCRMGLMFCPSPLLALREIRAALRPGARFSALVFSGPQTNPCITTILNTARRHAGLAKLNDHDPPVPGSLLSLGKPGLLKQLLTEAGFTEVAVLPLSAPFRFARSADYIDFVRSSGSPIMDLLKPLSALAQARAWNDMTSQLGCFETEQTWVGPNELLLASAVNHL